MCVSDGSFIDMVLFLSLQPLKNNKFQINKSRYDSIDSYLSCCGEKYNDIELTIDEDINKQLLDAGKEACTDRGLRLCALDTVLLSKDAVTPL